MYRMTVSAAAPAPATRQHRVVGQPAFRTGMRVVRNPKPNRNPQTPRPFIAAALVPFPFMGSARESLDRKGSIPTPVKHEVKRELPTWVAESL